MNQASPRLGEVLREARERKQIDVGRAERETKIRARYLEALEAGRYEELPGAVYTKGFLRNYGRYLDLQPEHLIALYRSEAGAEPGEPRLVSLAPAAAAAPRSLVITPGALLAVALTVLVAGFGAYLVYQFVTFARVPQLVITDPPSDIANYSGMDYRLRGRTEPNSRVTVDGLRENPETLADEQGEFEVLIGLVPGVNVITIVASDPRTGRDSEPQERTIYVVTEQAGETDPPGPTLTVTAPEDGATLADAPVAISVATDAERVTVSATPVAAPTANFTISDGLGRPVQLPNALPPAPPPLDLTRDAGGAFVGSYALVPGTWDLLIHGEGAGVGEQPLSETRRVTVTPRAQGLVVRLEVRGGPSYLELYQDGAREQTYSGRNAPDGSNIEVSATRTIRVRAGSAGAVTFFANGVRVGPMGAVGEVVEWTVTSSG